MIIRLIAVDPQPRPGTHSDVLVYQVPENSREFELLVSLLEKAGIDWTTVASPRKVEKLKEAK